MQALSQKKKMAIIVSGIALLVIVGLVGTGRVSLSGLKSDILNGSDYICSEDGQRGKLSQYTEAPKENEQLQKKIQIASGEVSLLEKKKLDQTNIITQKTAELKRNDTSIRELNAYIAKNCRNAQKKQAVLCNQKKQEVTKLKANNTGIQNAINRASSASKALEAVIYPKVRNITQWQGTIDANMIFINQYELCEKELKAKLLVTSPLMSGEVVMSGEVGRRVELYKFSMSIPAPAKAEINEIMFDTAFGPGNIELDEWYVTENSTTTSIYPCKLENNGQFRCALADKASGNFGLENGRAQNYSLSAMVKGIKESGSLKIYGISKEGVLYNGTRRDSENQSTPIKILYNAPIGIQVCGNGVKEGNEQCDDGNTNNTDQCDNTCKNTDTPGGTYVRVLTPNGGETYDKDQNITINWASSPDVTRVMVGYSACESCLDWITNAGPITNTGSVNWKVQTGYIGRGYRIRIFGYSDVSPVVEDFSDTEFSVRENTIALCGNGTREVPEECDDGNTNNTDQCDNTCKNRVLITCTDSDGGLNYNTKGQTTLSTGTIGLDVCISPTTLIESTCNPDTSIDGTIGNEYICPHGCNDGACKSIASTGTLTVSIDSSTPLDRIMLDNTSEHSLVVFRLAANNTENLDVDSIKITDDGTNGNDVVASFKFYNGATLLGTTIPDGSGNAELFLTDGTLVIPANDYKLVTVKAVLRDIDGTGFVNGDTLIATIAAAGDVDTTGLASGAAVDSTQTSVDGNTMTAYEAYPVVAFVADSGIGSAIALGSNQLVAKIGVTNPGNKDVTFQSGNTNIFSIQVQVVGDDTDTGNETVTLKDQDGTTLDIGTINSATGVTQIDFDMSSVGATVGTTIPAGQTKYFYIYADTSDFEDSGDQIQVWLDDNNDYNLIFGINGAGRYPGGFFIFRGDLYGPVLSRSI